MVAGGAIVDVDAQMKPNRGGGITSRWWFWTALGVVVAGGATATAVILMTEKDPENGQGFTPGRIPF